MMAVAVSLVLAQALALAAAPEPPWLAPTCREVTNASNCGARCRPLTTLKPRKFEVTGYHTCGYAGTNGSEWWQNDWSKLTVVADFCGEPAGKTAEFYGMLCEAHENGVQVVNWMDTTSAINQCPGAGFTVNGTNQTEIDQWVKDTVNRTQFDGYDGILFDIEGGGGCGLTGSAHNFSLTNALVEAADAMHAANKVSKVIIAHGPYITTWGDPRCDPTSSSYTAGPQCTEDAGPQVNTTHSTDWVRISEHFDSIQPMEYCSLDNGTAACAPLSFVNNSMENYRAAGIGYGKAAPIWPWLGIAYVSCKNSRVNGTDWSECSESSDPSWDGFPGCHLATSFKGWQACSQFNGYGNNMHFLPNATGGKQWSAKWKQHYFKLPPNVYNGQMENDGAASFPGNYTSNHGRLNQSVTMWQDDATSLRPKYEWAVKEWGGFGIWATGMVCPFLIYDQMQADYAAVGTSCEKELASMWGAIPSPYA